MNVKIKNVEIQNNGKTIQIETNRKDNYRFVWLEAENLPILADMSENL